MSAGPRPLGHVRVLDLSRFYPGAMCTLLLADLGADVVKVEGPGAGDGLRAVYGEGMETVHPALNRGKRSVTLDLKQPRAAEVLERLVADADVVVESHRPGALDAAGLGFDRMRAVNPRLVWCSITGFGPDGPRALAPGHDLTFVGASGLLAQLAPGGAPPLPEGTLAVPIGALTAAVGILAALTGRHATGAGSRVDISMTDAAMWAISDEVARQLVVPGTRWPHLACRRSYRCADDRWVTVSATEPRSWQRLCAALGLEGTSDDPFAGDQDSLIDALAAAFAMRPAGDWVAEPGLAGGVGPMNRPEDLPSDEQVVSRRSLVPVQDDAATTVVANPVRLDGADGEAASGALAAPPALGADTVDVLAAAGFTADEIADVRSTGVV